MIGGMVTHTGDPALGWHLLLNDENESVAVRMHGLCAPYLPGAIAELLGMGCDARTEKPLVHAWASPSIPYEDGQWEEYWDRFEAEFGLIGQPYAEARHMKYGKGGRIVGHRHRAYLRVSPEGRVLPMRHTVPRMEKLSRISEFMCGEPFISGNYNRSVIKRLAQEAYGAVADAMSAQGLGDHRAGTACSSAERAAADRTGDIPADEVKRRIFAVLSSRGSGGDLVAALAGLGIRLAMGDKAIVAVTPAGNAIALLRGYNQIARQRGGATMKKAELAARLSGVALAPLKDVVAEGSHHEDWITHVGAKRRECRDARVAETVDAGIDDSLLAGPAEDVWREQDVRHLSGDPEVEPGEASVRTRALETDRADYADPAMEPIDPSRLTPAQEQALETWMQTMFAPAATRQPGHHGAHENEDAPVENERAVRAMLKAENDHLGQPALQRPGWRDRYKAKLAGIPSTLGDRIAWVDRLEASRTRIRLKYIGAIITTEPGRIATSIDALETTRIIAGIAAGKGWDHAAITGGSAQWREALAQEATRAGIAILNSDLAEIVANEKRLMDIEDQLRAWQQARARAVETRTRADLEAVLETLEKLPPDILDHIEHERDKSAMTSDLDTLVRYRRHQARSLRNWSGSGASPPGSGQGPS